MRKIALLFSLILLGSATLFAQNQRVSGRVTGPDGSPLVGVMVTVSGTTIASISDADGQYSINAPSGGTLEFSLLGMQRQEVPISGRTTINVQLQADAQAIDDVIVVAYGVARRESFTGSASVIESTDLTKRSVSDVSKALAGLAPGVVTTSGGGTPGGGASIQIRGTGSYFASNDPLYVVDGAPYAGNISSINPRDIASISILKDASASALYGSRGANGVVMITTHRGNASGRVNVSFNASVGVISRGLSRYDTTNQQEFVELTYAALRNQALYSTGQTEAQAHTTASNGLASNLGGEQYNPFKNYTWQTLVDPATGKVKPDAQAAWDESWMDEITNYAAKRQDYGVSVNGGNERTTYAMSLGYLKEDGTLRNTDFERFTTQASVDHNIRHWAKIGVNTAYTYSIQNGTQYSDTQNGNVWYTAQFMAPIYPMYMKDLAGKDVLDDNGNRRFDYGDENESGGNRPKANQFNALGDLLDNKYVSNRDIIRYGGYLTLGSDSSEAGALQGLKFTVNINGDVSNRRHMSYYNMFHGDASASNGEITKELYRTASYTFNQLLTYNRTFGRHNINVLAGHEYYDYEHYNLWATRSNLYEGIYELAPGVTVQDGDSFTDRDTIEAYLGRINYGFDNKYYVDASYRRDGSSRFHKDHRWGDFWSVGASWRISQEDFMRSVSWVNNLTFKASYGSQGNNKLLNSARTGQLYYTWDAYYALNYPNANYPGAILSSLANQEVSWETATSFNAGIEASLFGNRLRVGLDYYIKNTTDMLLNYPMPLSTGFSGYSSNVGSMRNNGIEFTLSGTVMSRPNFVWDATIMGYTNKNKVTALTETTQIVSGTQVVEVGYPIFTFWMAKSAGVDPATGQQLYWVYDTEENPVTGEKTIVNERISSDKTKATNSRYHQGSRFPTFQGSIGSNFTIYKNFDFSFLTTFSLGGKIYDSNYAATMAPMYMGDTFNRHLLRAWKKPGDVTDIPRVEFNPAYVANDRWLINASYFAINNVTLGYTLPSAVSERINMGALRVYLTFDNIAMFSHLKGLDPTYNFSGGTNYTYAPVRTMSVGLDINF